MAVDWRKAGGLAAIVAVVSALAWLASDTPLKFDDLDWMAAALDRADDWTTWLRPMGFPHQRPWAQLAWWSLGRLGVDALALRLLLVALFVSATSLVVWTAGRRNGVMVGVLAAVGVWCMPWSVEVLDWRSWITSAGALLGIAVASVECGRAAPRWWVILLAGLFGVGFKETGALAVGGLGALRGPRSVRVVGGLLIGLGLLLSLAARSRLDLGHVGENALFHFMQMSAARWVVPIALDRLFPERPWVAVLGALAAVLLDIWAVVLVIPAAAWLIRREPWVGALAAGLVLLGLFDRHHVVVWQAEGWLVWLGAWALRPGAPKVGLLALSLAVALGAVRLSYFALDRPDDWREAAEQRAFLREFHPAPAQWLYFPEKRMDLDALVWMRMGAHPAGPPPDGGRPVQMGPRSGVWADAVPIDPARPLPEPRREGHRRGR